MASKVEVRDVTVVDLPFISILDKRPKAGEFILLGWDIQGWCGYESTYWDKDEEHCKQAVVWMPLPEEHVFTRRCAVVLKKKLRLRPVLLKWSKHFSYVNNGKYMSDSVREKEAYIARKPDEDDEGEGSLCMVN